jgi:membrane protein DedA with SNARE-associated domain
MGTISPIAIGTTQVETRKFAILNALAAAIWGPLFTLLGYAFGKAIDPLLGRFKQVLSTRWVAPSYSVR